MWDYKQKKIFQMKKLLAAFGLLIIVSCSNSTKDAEAPLKKVVCGDSFEQELFDSLGNSVFVKKPGDCDTVLVTEEK